MNCKFFIISFMLLLTPLASLFSRNNIETFLGIRADMSFLQAKKILSSNQDFVVLMLNKNLTVVKKKGLVYKNVAYDVAEFSFENDRLESLRLMSFFNDEKATYDFYNKVKDGFSSTHELKGSCEELEGGVSLDGYDRCLGFSYSESSLNWILMAQENPNEASFRCQLLLILEEL